MPDIKINEELFYLLLVIPIFLISITIHEFAHAAVANRLGDPTAKNQGRLTLNPLKHIELIGSVLLPLMGLLGGGFLIGWAKPVPVNPRFFRNPLKDSASVSFAGPLSNLLFAILFAAIIGVLAAVLPEVLSHQFAYRTLLMGLYLNTILFFFNMLPIPPLDGSHILYSIFPNEGLAKLMNTPYLSLGFLFLLFVTPLGGYFSLFTRDAAMLLLGLFT